jgi:Arc/MetJ-type ribon-helix-helix transcriptional regulator
MASKESLKTVQIPASLYSRIEKRIDGSTEFKTVSEYITFLVRETLNTIESEEGKKAAFSPEEEKEIEGRLRDLGYID